MSRPDRDLNLIRFDIYAICVLIQDALMHYETAVLDNMGCADRPQSQSVVTAVLN